ncbi:MAG: hypothetical protein WCP59_05625 [Actinomycetota bacterium]|jgi:hypothetical protein
MASPGHLVRRFVGSLSRQPPSAADEGWARGWLADAEWALWQQIAVADRRHAVLVARRFVDRRPSATRAEMAGALLHDIGKIDAGLGTLARVLATVVGPRTARFRRYHDHERIGAALLEVAGSDPVTVALVRGSGDAFADLCAADDI